jgi:uncharacterized protein
MYRRQITDWDRYALIAHIVGVLGDGHAFGRKAVQKVLYLLQELGGLPLGFPYTFYTYGVYSFELASALAAVESMKGIVATYEPALGAYDLGRGEKGEALENRGRDFLAEYGEKIDAIVDLSRGKTGKALELITTIVYVAHNEELGGLADEATLLERVAELKHRFSAAQIAEQVNDLRSRGHLPCKPAR